MSSSRRVAFISVTDKTGLVELTKHLLRKQWSVYCTDGTAKFLRNSGLYAVGRLSELTGFNEILGGRVKTLHPTIHGSILNHHDNIEPGLYGVGLVVANLYPFEQVFVESSSGKYTTNDDAMDLMDIGGHTMIRSAIKNHKKVTVLVDPNDYERYMAGTFAGFESAQKAIRYITNYDQMINRYFNGTISRNYNHDFDLKYGCNPHQKHSAVYTRGADNNPLMVLNGTPGYINITDAMHGIKLVLELKQSLNGCYAAASYKHNSPAGVAVNIDDQSVAFAQARNGDPKSSFGDFIALSDRVTVRTAELIRREVSDGIIAPDYDPEALVLLKAKKRGRFIVLQYDGSVDDSGGVELRDMFGITISQESDRSDPSNLGTIVTSNAELKLQHRIDLIVANTALKYAQSNSVCIAFQGQIIGLASGQQSRIDCVKLACAKAKTWLIRSFHPSLERLRQNFMASVKRQDRINAEIQYIENDFTEVSYAEWWKLFEKPDDIEQFAMSYDNKWCRNFEILKAHEWFKQFEVVMASDAFFPFRDSIDEASKIGTVAIVQPGGSNRDSDVIKACDEYSMAMFHSGIRLFRH